MKKQKTQKIKLWGKITKDAFIDFEKFNQFPEHLTEFEIDIWTFNLLIEQILKNQKKIRIN